MNLPLKKSTHVGRGRILVCLFILLVAATSLVACIPWVRPPLSQPFSPPPVINTPIVRWHVVDIAYQGESVPFEMFSPIYLLFGQGGLTLYSEQCPGTSVGWSLDYQGEQRYQLVQGMSAAADCGAGILVAKPAFDCAQWVGQDADKQDCIDAINRLYWNVIDVVGITNEYELGQDTLILRNDAADVRLVLDNPVTVQ